MVHIYVIGDIHGSYRAMMDCFKQCNLDYQKDTLIVLGDCLDGYPESYEVIEELLKIKKLIYIKGNHDADPDFAIGFFKTGRSKPIHYNQGGKYTVHSYTKFNRTVPQSHINMIESGPYYYKFTKKGVSRLFVHGGYNWEKPLKFTSDYDLMWNRGLFRRAVQNQRIAEKSGLKPKPLGIYDEIYIGHTTTTCVGSLLPLHICNVWAIDCGAGFEGKLCLMDVETNKYWMSDYSANYYKDVLNPADYIYVPKQKIFYDI